MENIAELLFENKEKIPDGLYVKLMNNLKISPTTNVYYKLKILTIPCSADESSVSDIATCSDPQKTIITEITKSRSELELQMLLPQIEKTPFIPFAIHNYEIPNDTPSYSIVDVDGTNTEVACYNVYVVIGVTRI